MKANLRNTLKNVARKIKWKYVEDWKVVSNVTATGLDSFLLKGNAKPIFETMISEPSAFSYSQTKPDLI